MKLTYDDNMRFQTLREQGLYAKAIKSAYPMKNWSIDTLKTMCQWIDATGSAVERRAVADQSQQGMPDRPGNAGIPKEAAGVRAGRRRSL